MNLGTLNEWMEQSSRVFEFGSYTSGNVLEYAPVEHLNEWLEALKKAADDLRTLAPKEVGTAELGDLRTLAENLSKQLPKASAIGARLPRLVWYGTYLVVLPVALRVVANYPKDPAHRAWLELQNRVDSKDPDLDFLVLLNDLVLTEAELQAPATAALHFFRRFVVDFQLKKRVTAEQAALFGELTGHGKPVASDYRSRIEGRNWEHKACPSWWPPPPKLDDPGPSPPTPTPPPVLWPWYLGAAVLLVVILILIVILAGA